MDESVKRVLMHCERFLQDVEAYLDEERTSYTLEELAQTRRATLRTWAEQAGQLRIAIIDVYPDVLEAAYPEYRALVEAAIADGAVDDELGI